jgi:two-component system response regulator PrrA
MVDAAANRTLAAPIRVGKLLVDPSEGVALWDGRDLGLTPRELALLEALARNAEVVVSRDHLLETVWGYDFAPVTKVIDVFMSYLRRKLAEAGAPPVIHTVRGIGFVLRRA